MKTDVTLLIEAQAAIEADAFCLNDVGVSAEAMLDWISRVLEGRVRQAADRLLAERERRNYFGHLTHEEQTALGPLPLVCMLQQEYRCGACNLV